MYHHQFKNIIIPALQPLMINLLHSFHKKDIGTKWFIFLLKQNIVDGDINAQIGKNINNKFSLHNSSNRNGEHLINFTPENRLTCINTKFLKRKGELWTYNYANNTKAQIEYILINKKWNNIILNCEAYFSFESVSSNHQIVTAKIILSLCRNAAWTTKTAYYDWSLLNNRDISNKYMLTLRNKFNALQRYQKHLLWMMNIRTLLMPT